MEALANEHTTHLFCLNKENGLEGQGSLVAALTLLSFMPNTLILLLMVKCSGAFYFESSNSH